MVREEAVAITRRVLRKSESGDEHVYPADRCVIQGQPAAEDTMAEWLRRQIRML